MSAGQVDLTHYRAGLIDSVAQAGQQAALSFDRDWSDEALEAVERLASDHVEFSADTLLELVGEPTSANAVGAVFGKASRAGLIRCVGYRTSNRISRHGGLQCLGRGEADVIRASETSKTKSPVFPAPLTRPTSAGFAREARENPCLACKAPIPPNPGRGRPRKFCTTCVPQGTGAAAIRAWRVVNPERVAAHNASRRKL